jgi:hypothetical protein
MKIKLHHIVLVTLLTSLTLTVCSCAALKSEFLGPQPAPPAITTNAVTGAVTITPTQVPVSVIPPISAQLSQAAPIVSALVPAPYGSLLAALMNLLATGAATYATFRAGTSATANAKSVAVAAALPSQILPTQKT